ncbi:MAG TPA: type IV pili twitching motility protein PilT, partial [Quisquiliibacterium sp.]|nr:type IV pili twitching motility protein PilT [Quisquiliibacterium sp.]
MVMERLFRLMAEKKASDLFVSVGSPINIKINGVAIPVNQQKLDAAAVEALVREILSERQWNEFVERRE